MRVTPEEGMQRYRQTFGDKVPTFELIILCLKFTEKGFPHFANDICDQAQFFCPRLSKKIFPSSPGTDWGVWHFVGDLPLIQTELLQFTFHRWNE